jgi:uncharacterized protein
MLLQLLLLMIFRGVSCDTPRFFLGEVFLNPLLNDLMETQFLSDELSRLQKIVKQAPTQIAKLDAQLKTARTKRDSIKDKIQATEMKIRKCESLTKDAKEQQGKYRNQMFTTKSNREYQTLNSEINALNDKISQYETDIIESLEYIDNAKAELSDSEKYLKEEEVRIAEEKDKLNAELREDQRRLQEIESGYTAKRSLLPEELLLHYDKLVRKNGRAVARLDQKTCGNCFVRVQPQIVARAFGNSNLVNCDKCGVFLYVSESLDT